MLNKYTQDRMSLTWRLTQGLFVSGQTLYHWSTPAISYYYKNDKLEMIKIDNISNKTAIIEKTPQ